MTSEPGSFAYNTFKVRVPQINDDIVGSNDFTPEITRAMHSLRDEITDGLITPLWEHAADAQFWNASTDPWHGRSWLDVPWYWAEAYFYRRVLQATCYFQAGAWFGVDPYRRQKQAELMPLAAPAALSRVLRSVEPDDHQQGFGMLFHASLWGNRTDLSYNVSNTVGPIRHTNDERDNLLVDDTELVWQHIRSSVCRKLVIINDNAGTELLMDLALVDYLLQHQLVDQITLHLKPQPFFVSDAMPDDVVESISALSLLPEPLAGLSMRLSRFMATGQLKLISHWYYCTGLFYFQIPGDLARELHDADLVILKGDANYRRLLGDAHWSPASSFTHATAYFPTPFVALRTLKAELIVGLGEGVAERLDRDDAQWRVNGRRGVIQSNLGA